MPSCPCRRFTRFNRLITTCAAIALCCPVVFADIYQYTDKNGTVCMTNNLDNIPPARRKSVKITREEQPAPARSKAVNDIPQREQSVTPQQTETPQKIAAKTTQTAHWLKIIGAALAISALFLAILRLGSTLASPQLAKVISVAFFLGVFVFGYKLYADHLVNGYFTVKQRMIALFAKAQQREGLSPPPSRPTDLDP